MTKTVPANGAPGVALDSNITVTFSQRMRASTIKGNTIPGCGVFCEPS